MNDDQSEAKGIAWSPGHDVLESALQEKVLELYQRFLAIRTTILTQLASRQQGLHDTGAESIHLTAVQRNIGRLVPSAKIAQYNAIELFVLLVAVYLHDVGKTQVADPEEQHHSAIGRKILVEHAQALNLEEPEALAIGYIIEGHGTEDINHLPEFKSVAPYGTIRIRYLAALLRLADDLDIAFTRAPRNAREIVQPGSDIIGKWNLRRCVDDVVIDSRSWVIEVEATPRSAADQAALLREVEIINARLMDGRRYLRGTPEIGLYYSIIDVNLDYYWLKRIPEQLASDIDLVEENSEEDALSIPSNTAVIIIKYDPITLGLYRSIIDPSLRASEMSPLLIEEMLPEDTMLERTIRMLEKASIVVALLAGGGGPSVHFRLGVAVGLRKEIMAFTTSGATTIGDLCGLRPSIYDNAEDLRRQFQLALDGYVKTVQQRRRKDADKSRR